ncbi:MAG: EF-P lysine aminoacylase GenX [Planctomycetia bacterium]|nr:EF-P lysine aminoacylase GenX [Planctomycetia bacterium]
MDSDFLPTASWPNLRIRAELLRRAREFFYDRGFLEVETPLLSADVVVDRHLDPLSVILPSDPRRPAVGRRLWLQTSPEFAMKRLLAAGATAIFQVAKAFRAAETGPLHNPEFTMLEWYRAGDDYAAGMQLLADFCQAMLGGPAPEGISYSDAFVKFAGIEPHGASCADLEKHARKAGISAAPGLGDDKDAWLDLILVERVQPQLGVARPAILYDYPASQAALAKVRRNEKGHDLAERFELFFRGIELANGYHELLNAEVLRARAQESNRQRQSEGKAALPEESRLLAAMVQGLPPCCGVALGFDRLAMIAAGASRLEEVLAFPMTRA